MVINILILFFSILLIYQIFLANFNLIEKFDNNCQYDTNNPNNVGILSQQNAGNIDALKKQIEQLLPLNGKVQDLSGNVTNLSKQIESLIQSQQQYAESVSSIKV
jgi:methyl-accepting chemotaxis protein